MQISTPEPHPKHSRGMTDEADIGSGEKTPGQLETDKIVAGIEPVAGTDKEAGPGGDVERPARPATGKEAEMEAAKVSEHERAGHGQLQREQNPSRQESDPGMTPDAAV